MTISARQLALAILMIALATAANAALAEAPPEDPQEGNWTFDVAPYFFLPAMTGSVTVKGLTLPVDTSVPDIFTENDLALTLAVRAEAWYKHRWGMAFDGLWAMLEQRNRLLSTPGPLPLSTLYSVTMHTGIFEVAGLYDLFGGRQGGGAGKPEWDVQLMFGTRITMMHTRFDFSAPSLPGRSVTQYWGYPMGGARGAVHFGPGNRIVAILRGDIGGGAGSDFSWNAVGGFGYDFQIGKAMSTVLLLGRALSQDYSDDDFTWDVIQYGPMLAWNFRF
jgi:hypothetical protein